MNQQTEIEILKLEKAIAELDADWFSRQDSFKVHGKGRDYIPSTKNTKLYFIIVSCIDIFASIIIIVNNQINLLIFPIIIMLIYGIQFYLDYEKAKIFEGQEAIYLKKRENLTMELNVLRRKHNIN
jgi:phage-related holin